MSPVSSIYGLGLQINVPIASLAALPEPDRIDVHMTLGALPPDLDQFTDEAICVRYVSPHLDEHGQPELTVTSQCGSPWLRVAYSDGMTVVIDTQGTLVWAAGPGSDEDIASYLLGPILGLVLRLRGIACLHASAIAVGQSAIAFVGPSGSGKSTTAAAFARRGYAVLTDDKLALLQRDDGFQAQPAYPSVRLWSESVNSLFGSEDALPRIGPNTDKRLLDLSQPGFLFQSKPLPLAAIYFLGERTVAASQPHLQAMSPQAGLMSLISDLHATSLLDRKQRRFELEFLAQLAENVPMRNVTPNADLACIDQLCQAILEDFEQLVVAASAYTAIRREDRQGPIHV